MTSATCWAARGGAVQQFNIQHSNEAPTSQQARATSFHPLLPPWTMLFLQRTFVAACLLLMSPVLLVSAFTVTNPSVTTTTGCSSLSCLNALPPTSTLFESSTSQLQAAATVDPAAALSNILGNFLNSPAILAIPILAALGVASLIAFLIYAYAQPAVDDDE